jgi:hypothetical protein
VLPLLALGSPPERTPQDWHMGYPLTSSRNRASHRLSARLHLYPLDADDLRRPTLDPVICFYGRLEYALQFGASGCHGDYVAFANAMGWRGYVE